MSRARIRFGTRVPWVACSQPGMEAWAKNAEIKPRGIRILFAALAQSDSRGHARWLPGELADVLGMVDPSTGEIVAASKDAVSDAIKWAKDRGLIDRESCSACIVLPPHMFQRAYGPSALCPVHGW